MHNKPKNSNRREVMLTNYFTLLDQQPQQDSSILFTVKLNPDCEVYEGHFPGNPVCPGVCNLQMLKECIEHYTGKTLIISDIKQCRYTAVISPLTQSVLNFKAMIAEAENGYAVQGTVYDERNIYIDIKFQLTINN